MLFIEYNWTACSYCFRIGSTFTDFQGVRSLPSIQQWRAFLDSRGFKVGPKTDNRTWSVVSRKTPGQLAYEADCAARPVYHDGTTRKPWGDLGDVEQWSWERNPTPRA